MGCLFGYCGERSDGLLDRMAELLKHRCSGGWERASLEVRESRVVELGRGIPPWSEGDRLIVDSARKLAWGHSGVLFSKGPLGGGISVPSFRSTKEREAGNGAGGLRELLEALARDPEKGLQGLEGCFTGALCAGDDFYLARDPSGVKAIYWTKNGKRLLFASEVKALFADPPTPRRMRPGALAEYLTFSFVPGEGTMFEDVRELQPGTLLKYRRADISLRRHFVFENLEENGGGPVDPRAHAARVRHVLERSVEECCAGAPGPPAVFLSGGIDSSAVLAVAARRFSSAPLKTFSVHFGSRYANENSFVSMMAERYATDHTWLEIRPRGFLKEMRRIVWYLDDPIGDPITVPNFLMARAAARSSSLVLNGEGGDPCFGGPKNIPMLLTRLYGPLPGQSPESWLEKEYLRSYRKCYGDLDRILAPDLLKETGAPDALADIVAPFFRTERPRSFVNKLMTTNIRLKGANLILVKVDKMSSANGILALPPLFTKAMVEASMACPPTLKLRGNVEKGVLKDAVEDIVPPAIVQRPKCGMMVPVRFWFQGEMRRYAKRVLSKKNLDRAGFFNTSYVRRLLDYDKSEVHGFRHGLKLWMLVTFFLWHEQMIEGLQP